MNDTVKRYRTTMRRIGITLLIWMAVFWGLSFLALGIGGVFSYALPEKTAETVISLASSAAYLAAFTFAAALFHFINKQPYDQPVRFTPKLPKNSFVIIFAGVGCVFSLSMLNSILVQLMGFSSPTEIFSYPAVYSPDYSLVLQFIAIGLVPAFCEELLFRGVILSNLMPYGKASAIVISSILFGLMHGNIYQFLYTTVAGIVMGAVYVLTESLWCSILLHMINNTLSILQLAITDRFSEEYSWIILVIYEILVIFIGILCAFRLITKAKNGENELAPKLSRLTFSNKISIRDTAKGFLVVTVLVFVIISWVEGLAVGAIS